MIVEMACLYTSCECPSRRSRTQKLSNHVTTPCSFTPFTRKMASGVLPLRTWLRKVSCKFCERSAAIVVVPVYLPAGPFPPAYCQPAVPLGFLFTSAWTLALQGTRPDGASTSWGKIGQIRPNAEASAPFGKAVEGLPQGFRNRAGPPVANRLAVDPDDRHHDLGRGAQERLAGGQGLCNRKGTLLKGQALRRDRPQQHVPGDAAQDRCVGSPGD